MKTYLNGLTNRDRSKVFVLFNQTKKKKKKKTVYTYIHIHTFVRFFPKNFTKKKKKKHKKSQISYGLRPQQVKVQPR